MIRSCAGALPQLYAASDVREAQQAAEGSAAQAAQLAKPS